MLNLLSSSNNTLIDNKARGIPSGTFPFKLAEAGKFGWSLPSEDVCLPSLALNLPVMQANLNVMNQYAKEQGVYLCPHGKTMMSPQLFDIMLQGKRTIGLSAATVAQATVMAESGAKTVLLANQVVGKANIRRFAEICNEFPDVKFLLLIESSDALGQLVSIGAEVLEDGRHFELLIEVGFAGARTGIQTSEVLDKVLGAYEIHKLDNAPIRLNGLEAYEGAIGGTLAERLDKIGTYLEFAIRAYELIVERELIDPEVSPIFTAGGSSTFDLVVNAYKQANFTRTPELWLRGGVAATFDHVAYHERLGEMDERNGFELAGELVSAQSTFEPALAVWAAVQSKPTPDLAILAAGIRDFPYDAGLPVALSQFRGGQKVKSFDFENPSVQITKANDQHAFLSLSEGDDVRVGDVIKFGISHPCTAFDKWKYIFCVDRNDQVTTMIETFF